MRSSIMIAIAAVFDVTSAVAQASDACMASVYSDGFNRVLADGKHHSVDELLVAHRTLPFGTIVTITLIDTGATVRAVVRDRGPFVRNRCIDLSRGTARALGLASVGRVRIERVVGDPVGLEASAK